MLSRLRVEMPRIAFSVRKTVIVLEKAGHSIPSIHKRLKEEGVLVDIRSLYRLSQKFRERRAILDLPRRKRAKRLSPEMMDIIDNALKLNGRRFIHII